MGSGISGNNNGIALRNVSGVAISANTINNAENGIDLIDAANTNISNNMVLYSRAKSVSVVQNTALAGTGNTISSNSILQRNPDYPYIEMRDETIGGVMSNLLSANGNAIYPNYKPNTSLVRKVKLGGDTVEYAKADLTSFDPTVTKFEYFGYSSYTSTGSYATANLLSNPDFDTDATGWTPASLSGASPTLTYQPTGSYTGGSVLVTPQDMTPDRILVTNDAILSITAGQVYEVTGYVATTTGTINLRASLHQGGVISNLYSDRVAETYATNSGRTFKFYLKATTTAADAQFSLETSNQNASYEIDSVSVRRVSALSKNNNANEVLIFSNTGSSAASVSCPGGVPCFQYVDTTNNTISWPISVPAYGSTTVFWNASPNILNIPNCSMNLAAGSVPNGQTADVTWTVSNSLSNTMSYTTNSGAVNQSVTDSGTLSFFPPPDGVTTIALSTVNDVGPKTCSVQVTTTNTAPSIFPSTITGSEDDVEIAGTLSGIDYNPGDSVFFEKTTNPVHGSLTVDLSGSIHYIPFADYCGTDTFKFRAADQYGHYADPIDQTVDVACVNDAPAVVDDSVTATGGSLTFDPTLNDTDPDSPYVAQTFTVTGYTLPTHGTLSLVGNSFQYIGNLGYIGSDSFQYRIVDQSGALSNTGTVTISVVVPNTPPTDQPASYTGTEDVNVLGTLSGSDINNDSLSFTVSTLPLHGSVTLGSNGAFTYVPTANYNGADSFVYQSFDGQAYSSGATIDLALTSVPDAPVATPDSLTMVQDTSTVINVLGNDTDVDSTGLTVTGISLPAHGTAIVSGTGIQYTPTPGYVGTDSFTYQAEDETNLLSNTVTVTVNILTSNTAPVSSDLSVSTNEDTPLSSTLSGSDAENDTLTYTVDTLPIHGTLSVTTTGAFLYTPALNYYGSDTFTYHVSDAMFSSSISTVSININGVNDAPVAQTNALYTMSGNTIGNSGYTVTGSLVASDIDSPVLTYTATVLPVHGSLVLNSSGTFIYQPALGYTGTDTFSFVAQDQFLAASNTGTITITVVGYNSAPYANPAAFSTFEDTTLVQNLIATDPEGDTLSYIVDAVPTHGTLNVSSTGAITYIPVANYNGADSFMYHVTDGLLTSTSSLVTLTVVGVNDAPVAIAGNYTMSGNTLSDSGYSLSGVVSGTDIDSVNLSYVTTATASHGTLTLLASGSFQYTPSLDFIGTDTFSFIATDSSGAVSASAVVTIVVGTIPTPPPSTGSTPVTIVSTAGPGGGGAGAGIVSGGSQTLIDAIFNSAPSGSKSSSYSSPFVILPGQELAGQLFLMNRNLSHAFTTSPLSQNTTSNISTLNQILDQFVNEETDSVLMRKLARMLIAEADVSSDPITLIDLGSESVLNMDTAENDRMMATQLYVLRLFEARKRLYEQIVNRDVTPIVSNKDSQN